MTIEELKEILNCFEDSANVIVFVEENSTVYDVGSISDNNGHLQLNTK